MQLNRTQRRFFTRKSTEGKRIEKLSFLHPDRIKNRMLIQERGQQQHEEFTMAVQEKLVERIIEKESSLKKELKANKILKVNIDHYMEVWSGVNFWPKPKDFYSLRKELKKLNKEYGVNG